jgi:hypothetical protein
MTPLSLTDQNTLDRLRDGRNGLLTDNAERSALKVLRRQLQTITRNVYILHYLIDEGEIYCDILIDGARLCTWKFRRRTRRPRSCSRPWRSQRIESGNRKCHDWIVAASNSLWSSLKQKDICHEQENGDRSAHLIDATFASTAHA